MTVFDLWPLAAFMIFIWTSHYALMQWDYLKGMLALKRLKEKK
jgi:hypothetical protein